MRLSRIIFPLLVLGGAMPGAAEAQSRRTLGRGEPEAQLLGYYAAVMQFTPVGLPSKDGRLEIGGAVSLIPAVSLEDRTVGFGGTKTEETNFCPVFPRLTASKGFGRTSIEAGITPPVEVCGAKANVLAVAVGRRFTIGRTWDGVVRVSAMSARVDVSATCSEDMVADPQNQTCFEGHVSHDRVAPFGVGLEFLAASRGDGNRKIEPYVSAGIRFERIDFDVNYTRDVGHFYPALDDHNRLRTSLSRVHIAVGAAWDVARHVRLGGEVYYAPGALMTLRGRMAIVL